MAVHSTNSARRQYDHNLRNAVCAAGDPRLFDEIPLGTQRTWINRGPSNVVSFGEDTSTLLVRIQRLERTNQRLRNVIRLLIALTRAFGFTLDGTRMPSANGKRTLMNAVHRAAAAFPRTHALRVIGLTPSRWTAWEQASRACELEDVSSCPRSRPTRLSAREMMAMKELVTSAVLSYMPIRALALLAQRQNIIHVSLGTWYRTIRKRAWRRPRIRVHPKPAVVGLRASYPGQYLHIDITVIKLLDGTTAYVQAIIDNFSRLILAHAVSTTKTAAETASLILEARSILGPGRPEATIIADDGGENTPNNVDVAAALKDGLMSMLIAQEDILCSNSMIERFWLSMKHSFLFTQKLDSITALRRFVDFYISEHNTVIPHSAFNGQTPVEGFCGEASGLRDQLASKRIVARDVRLLENRGAACGGCPTANVPIDPVP